MMRSWSSSSTTCRELYKWCHTKGKRKLNATSSYRRNIECTDPSVHAHSKYKHLKPVSRSCWIAISNPTIPAIHSVTELVDFSLLSCISSVSSFHGSILISMPVCTSAYLLSQHCRSLTMLGSSTACSFHVLCIDHRDFVQNIFVHGWSKNKTLTCFSSLIYIYFQNWRKVLSVGKSL